MRLTAAEIDAIRECAKRRFGEGCTIRLFGSRTDDRRRGGDIDLHIEAESYELASLSNELTFRQEPKERIGEKKIDVTVREPRYTSRAIDLIAIQTGLFL